MTAAHVRAFSLVAKRLRLRRACTDELVRLAWLRAKAGK